MTVIALAGVLAVLAIVAMAYVIGRLQGEVRRLSADLRSATAEPAVAPTPAPELAAPAPVADDDSAVPVITAMSDSPDDVDYAVPRVASVTLGRPLIKVAAFGHGLRHALGDERRFRVRYAMRRELRRQRRVRRRRRNGWAAPGGRPR